jgi:hypothetical protein
MLRHATRHEQIEPHDSCCLLFALHLLIHTIHTDYVYTAGTLAFTLRPYGTSTVRHNTVVNYTSLVGRSEGTSTPLAETTYFDVTEPVPLSAYAE